MNQVALDLNITQGALSDYLNGKKVPSLAMMEQIATAIGLDLSDMLQDGRALLAGEAPAPPVAAVQPPAPPTISPEREMELLRQIADMAAKRETLSDEMLAKDKIIATTTEALRIKDIEVAEKREALTAKDQIIGQLVALLKEAGLEHTIPPALTSLIRASRTESQER